ncbi:uncharacterized protein LOC144163307 isoform X2 [Haemaphysalis longicornis]
MDSRFSLCLCHPRSQPARSDKRIPTRASRTSFTRPFPFLPGVIMVPAFDRLLPMRTGHRRAGRGRHRDVQNAVRVELYMAAPVLKSINPVCNRPLCASMRPGYHLGGRCRHRAFTDAVRVELSVAAPVLELNPVRNRGTAFVVCTQSMRLAGSVGSSDIKYCRSLVSRFEQYFSKS